MQNQILGPTRDDNFTIQHVTHVTRGQKPVGGDYRFRGLHVVIVTGHQARPFHKDVADLTVPEHCA